MKLCNEGPADKLNQTIYCQPAIMVTSLAALELLKLHRRNAIESCIATAGFSLGEITALAFAGAMKFDQGDILKKLLIFYCHERNFIKEESFVIFSCRTRSS